MSDAKGTQKRLIEAKLQEEQQMAQVRAIRAQFLLKVAGSMGAGLEVLCDVPQDRVSVALNILVALALRLDMPVEQLKELVGRQYEGQKAHFEMEEAKKAAPSILTPGT